MSARDGESTTACGSTVVELPDHVTEPVDQVARDRIVVRTSVVEARVVVLVVILLPDAVAPLDADRAAFGQGLEAVARAALAVHLTLCSDGQVVGGADRRVPGVALVPVAVPGPFADVHGHRSRASTDAEHQRNARECVSLTHVASSSTSEKLEGVRVEVQSILATAKAPKE